MFLIYHIIPINLACDMIDVEKVVQLLPTSGLRAASAVSKGPSQKYLEANEVK